MRGKGEVGSGLGYRVSGSSDRDSDGEHCSTKGY